MKKGKTRLVIASTTSTQNSGLFDILIPAYEKATEYNVATEIVAVGTGKAIRIAKKGEADMLFVHDPFREEKFVAEGYGVNRRAVMHNDFVVVGPVKDPAGIRGIASAVEAFELIAEHGAAFISRGDDSGTNIRELDIWDDAGINPKGKAWYMEMGSKMGETLLAASERETYTIADMGTFLNYEDRLKLKVLVKGDPILRNQYSVIAVNPARFPDVRYREAMDFIAFVTSFEGQKLIATYLRHGANLFYPDAIPLAAQKRK
ncbi:MAG TPA: substrate-binding domain-containing protein [Thermodesulfovibrionales bacterium]|nr:substrate-binding domain-containing protein [Thermodesulfovibrionales bacterium]